MLDNQEKDPSHEGNWLDLVNQILDDRQAQMHTQHTYLLLLPVELGVFAKAVERSQLYAQAHEQVCLLLHSYQNTEQFDS